MTPKLIKKLDAVSVLILNQNNEVLLQKKTHDYAWFPGKWCLFGGMIDPGETPEYTASREIREELGISLSDLTVLKESHYKDESHSGGGIRKGKWHLLRGFYDSDISNPLSNINIKEGAGMAFFDFSDLRYLNLLERHKNAIEWYFRRPIQI